MSVLSVSSLSASDVSFTRRVKPLPKRRGTSLPRPEAEDYISTTDPPPAVPTYYHPISSGRIDRLKEESKVTHTPSNLSNGSPSFSAPPRIGSNADKEGDYTDHLQQPNNTKKRKVPAATITAARESNLMRDNDDLIDEDFSQDCQPNVPGEVTDNTSASYGPQALDYQTIVARRKPTSLVTVATLRVKELLKARRKMMATAIHEDIDPLALEFALSAPFARPPIQPPIHAWSYGPKFRRRPCSRTIGLLNREPCFSRSFTFSFPSSISKRYTMAKKVASGLQLRFQTELARQATTAAEMTLKTTPKPSNSPGAGKKVDSNLARVPTNGPGIDKTSKQMNKSKRKKRSALANASNPHHLRNYVPSRVLYPGHPASSAHGQSQSSNSLGPPALKFLSATLPPRRKGRIPNGENSGPSLIGPETEWICPFCEYSLFYGDDAGMQRAVRNRRRILTRRRNARERAAAAASGTAVPRSRDSSDNEGEDETDGDDDSFGESSSIAPNVPLPQQVTTTGTRQDNRGPHPGG
ncbi:hypothetical protein OPQ81_007622 [Rhizoctonia solani]|nr:hypothetical protein OPQ81_007622 [Rhizoctonia solani]